MSLKNGMKRFVIILLFSLLTPTLICSQTILPTITEDSLIVITPEQLKVTNLIFNEHKMLSEKVKLLDAQIDALEKINEIQDSIRNQEVIYYKNRYEKEKRLKKTYRYGTIVTFLLGILIGKL